MQRTIFETEHDMFREGARRTAIRQSRITQNDLPTLTANGDQTSFFSQDFNLELVKQVGSFSGYGAETVFELLRQGFDLYQGAQIGQAPVQA